MCRFISRCHTADGAALDLCVSSRSRAVSSSPHATSTPARFVSSAVRASSLPDTRYAPRVPRSRISHPPQLPTASANGLWSAMMASSLVASSRRIAITATSSPIGTSIATNVHTVNGTRTLVPHTRTVVVPMFLLVASLAVVAALFELRSETVASSPATIGDSASGARPSSSSSSAMLPGSDASARASPAGGAPCETSSIGTAVQCSGADVRSHS
mmetsp:Transcript_18294/g.56755  ORF Transcript_18294/g.56755 Transcript_18294/m.56755 type:complete len:215 (+) Transcript_18294:719-1363(+)